MSTGRTLNINRTSTETFVTQIYHHYSSAIRSGLLIFGTKLPSIRDLAEQLQINKISVVDAYERLTDEHLIKSRPGSGYFVSYRSKRAVLIPENTSSTHPAAPDLDNSTRTSRFETVPAHQELFKKTPDANFVFSKLFQDSRHVFQWAQPSGETLTSLGGSQSPFEQFPMDDLRSIARGILQDAGSTSFGYGQPHGLSTLRSRLAAELELRGVPAFSEGNILLTGGALQGINLILDALTSPGDAVAVESPSFTMMFPTLKARNLKIIEIDRTFDELNMSPEKEKEITENKVKLIFLVPTFHNPTGGTLSLTQRHSLLNFAQRNNCFVVENDVYHGLNFGEMMVPPIVALGGFANALYVSSFSKVFVPGLRVGYVAGSKEILDKMAYHKVIRDVSSSALDQNILCEFLSRGMMRKHLQKSRDIFRSRRDTLNAMLKKISPTGSSWTLPEGGLFSWFEFPPGATPHDILEVALERGIELAPGNFFYPTPRKSRHMRLNFATLEPVGTYRALEATFSLWRAASSKVRNGK